MPGSNVRPVEKIVFFSVVMRSCSVACARSGRTACMCGHAHKAGSTALRTPNHPQVSSYKPTRPRRPCRKRDTPHPTRTAWSGHQMVIITYYSSEQPSAAAFGCCLRRPPGASFVRRRPPRNLGWRATNALSVDAPYLLQQRFINTLVATSVATSPPGRGSIGLPARQHCVVRFHDRHGSRIRVFPFGPGPRPHGPWCPGPCHVIMNPRQSGIWTACHLQSPSRLPLATRRGKKCRSMAGESTVRYHPVPAHHSHIVAQLAGTRTRVRSRRTVQARTEGRCSACSLRVPHPRRRACTCAAASS